MSEAIDNGTGHEGPSASIVSTSSGHQKPINNGSNSAPGISTFNGSRGNGSRKSKGKPNVFIRSIRSVFGYRKTSLSLFVFLTVVAVLLLSLIDNSLEASVSLPSNDYEAAILDDSWFHLQKIGTFKHPYGSEGNKFVHDYLEQKVKHSLKQAKLPYIEYDNDLNNNNTILFSNGANSVAYYESNNIMVRINGSRDDLPALLVSAHYDSVPSSYGITDDGVGISSLLGILNHFTSDETKQPLRTIILNFNNNEEFGLFGASAFLNHPWSKNVKYFINLEGTGDGGKAILFRGTDYGILKQYGSVRYPYASSIFQQAFNSRVIHSETDYKIYFEDGGLRGIDVAFFKPRDIYHTGRDDIRHTSKLAVWHMLSTTLDFVNKVGFEQLDIDQDYIENAIDGDNNNVKINTQFASYTSFLNYFFIISLPTLVAFNISLLVIAPVICMVLLVVIFGYKQNWRIGIVNSIKFPISLVISIIAVHTISTVIQQLFEFAPNSVSIPLVGILAILFMLINYLILNTINFLFRNYKVIQHDEKLIVTLQISFIYWLLLIVSTARLAVNKYGNDHTGEGLLPVLFIVQSIGCMFGLLGWCFKASKRELELELNSGASQPLLVSQRTDEYGAAYDDSYDDDDDETHGHYDSTTQAHHPIGSDDSSFISIDSYAARKKLSLIQKTFSYDWFIQYLILVPIPALVIYNNGWLILNGVAKSIQESYKNEELIYSLIEYVAMAFVFPFLPFVFKVNRVIIYLLVLTLLILSGFSFMTDPFNIDNPMKLRFIQTANLSESLVDSYVHVKGRAGIDFENILMDMPSFKSTDEKILCSDPIDGMIDCSYKTNLYPQLLPDSNNFSDYLSVDILKNSSSNDYPYGLLTGEIKINVKDNNMCNIVFNTGRTKDFPVKTIVIYQDAPTNSSNVMASSIPEGFSTDSSGNFIFKDLSGITSLALNKLDSDKPYHIGFQWLPNLLDEYDDNASKNSLKLDVNCYWGNLGEDNSLVPAYQELNHFSPMYVSWANQANGMVSVSSSLEI